MKKEILKCENCKEKSEVKIRYTFLGFHKMVCPKCNYKNIYPLGKWYRIFYITILIVIGLLFVSTSRVFMGGIPGVLLIASIIALYYDYGKRKKMMITKFDKNINLQINTSFASDDLKKKETFEPDNYLFYYCSRCGAKVSSDAHFCPKCGEKI